MSKGDKLLRAIHQAIQDYNGMKDWQVVSVENPDINSHHPEEFGVDSIEDWKIVYGTVWIKTSIVEDDCEISGVSKFEFTANVEYTEDKEFKCSISRLNKM